MKRTGFSAETKGLVAYRSGGLCEVCGEGFSDMEYHHRRPRGMGGTRRTDTNGAAGALHACGSCHRRIESYRLEAYDNGWLVKQSRTPADVPVLRRGVWVELRDSGAIIPHTPELRVAP